VVESQDKAGSAPSLGRRPRLTDHAARVVPGPRDRIYLSCTVVRTVPPLRDEYSIVIEPEPRTRYSIVRV